MNSKMYSVERLTKEEYDMATQVVQKIREENARLAAIETAKSILDAGVVMMIDLVGIEETKTILRERSRKL